MKYLIFTCLFFSLLSPVFSQNKSIGDLYMDFRVARTSASPSEGLQIGAKILAHTDALPTASLNNFNYHMGKLYEVNHEDEKAIAFYEKVATAIPDYYVPHLALGNLYLKSAGPLIQQMNASKNNKAEYYSYLVRYKSILLRAAPHLEKAQACDPNEDTLKALEYIYQTLKTPEKYTGLERTLAPLAVNCISILLDE